MDLSSSEVDRTLNIWREKNNRALIISARHAWISNLRKAREHSSFEVDMHKPKQKASKQTNKQQQEIEH